MNTVSVFKHGYYGILIVIFLAGCIGRADQLNKNAKKPVVPAPVVYFDPAQGFMPSVQDYLINRDTGLLEIPPQIQINREDMPQTVQLYQWGQTRLIFV